MNLIGGSNERSTCRNPSSFETSAESAANAIICLIHQANYLLDQQLRQLEKQFLEEGGFTEKLFHARRQARKNQ